MPRTPPARGASRSCIAEAIGIDPDLAWDEDGACYLTWHVLDFTVAATAFARPRSTSPPAPSRAALPGVAGQRHADGRRPAPLPDRRYWYLMLAEGGTERGHCVTVARALDPRGPFESCPWNPVFTHRSSTHPVQNVGHADLVETPDGEWAAVYLGARTRGSTPGFHVLGRETFLAGVDWSTVGPSSTKQDSTYPRWIRHSLTGSPIPDSIRDGSCQAVSRAAWPRSNRAGVSDSSSRSEAPLSSVLASGTSPGRPRWCSTAQDDFRCVSTNVIGPGFHTTANEWWLKCASGRCVKCSPQRRCRGVR